MGAVYLGYTQHDRQVALKSHDKTRRGTRLPDLFHREPLRPNLKPTPTIVRT